MKSGFRSLVMKNMTAYLQELEDMGRHRQEMALIRNKHNGFKQLLPGAINEVQEVLSGK